MRKIVVFFPFFVIILFVLTSVVYAVQDGSTAGEQLENKLINKEEQKSVREEKEIEAKTRIQEAQAEKKATIEALREQRQELKQEKTEDRLTVIVQFTIRKIEAAIIRLENIIERFSSRMDKIGEKRDVTAAKAQLNLAKNNLSKAKTALETLKTVFDSFAESEDLKTTFMAFRDQVKEIKKYLTETHKALKMGIAGLKVQTTGVVTPAATLQPTVQPTVILSPTVVPTITEGVNTP